MRWTFIITERIYSTRFCAAWHPGIFSVAVLMLVFVCVISSEGRIQLSASYLRSHNDVWNPNSAELLSIPEPQGFSLWWQLSLPLSLSPLRLSACRCLSLTHSLCSFLSLKTVTSTHSSLRKAAEKCGGWDWQSNAVRNRQWLLRRSSR